MQEFKIIFSRYNCPKGTQISAAKLVMAESFNDAVSQANLLLEGMKSCSDGWDYRLSSIEGRIMTFKNGAEIFKGPELWANSNE